ncbi:hypothetical protein [Nguyenibacter sp. L1]|uniref:hypothetical protein n=1 Tax=Nguyenibacter sp. L1 TaxID=3049350 RepID=UPI002B4977FC|nr:hypothetical protein [Nguyenibacter sp. L1]WRH89393.1 hypothetical protein QN315_07305 [Nguyenibacter sp. L1]
MKKISLFLAFLILPNTSFSQSVQQSQTPEEFAASTGTVIADHLMDSPADAEQVQNNGSMTVITNKCDDTFKKRADLRPICVKAGMDEDAKLFASATSKQTKTSPESDIKPVINSVLDIFAYGNDADGKEFILKGYVGCDGGHGNCLIIGDDLDINKGYVLFTLNSGFSFEIKKRLVGCTTSDIDDNKVSGCKIIIKGVINLIPDKDEAGNILRIINPSYIEFIADNS